MQPYFMPYIGYFQLINAVDVFVVYDNIEYTKKGWINRNRILVNGKDEFITLPLKKDSDYLHINQRYLADSFEVDKQTILRKIKECYRKAPNFKHTYNLLEEIFNYKNYNLFDFIFNSITMTCCFLEIKTNIIKSSTLKVNYELKAEEKVLAICKELNSKIYFNPIGGIHLYKKDNFSKNNIQLKFIQTTSIFYNQGSNDFIPLLSIIDLLMFNDLREVKNQILLKFQLL